MYVPMVFPLPRLFIGHTVRGHRTRTQQAYLGLCTLFEGSYLLLDQLFQLTIASYSFLFLNLGTTSYPHQTESLRLLSKLWLMLTG